jgi:hypothetical protein
MPSERATKLMPEMRDSDDPSEFLWHLLIRRVGTWALWSTSSLGPLKESIHSRQDSRETMGNGASFRLLGPTVLLRDRVPDDMEDNHLYELKKKVINYQKGLTRWR